MKEYLKLEKLIAVTSTTPPNIELQERQPEWLKTVEGSSDFDEFHAGYYQRGLKALGQESHLEQYFDERYKGPRWRVFRES